MRFKVGDKVKVVDIICSQGVGIFELDPKYLLNRTGVITEVDQECESGYPYKIMFDEQRIRNIIDNTTDSYTWRDDELEFNVNLTNPSSLLNAPQKLKLRCILTGTVKCDKCDLAEGDGNCYKYLVEATDILNKNYII